VPDPSSPEVASKSSADIGLADQMASYWTNFAKTGNPNGPDLPAWPEVGQLKRHEAFLLMAEDKSAPGATMTMEQVALYDALFQRDVAQPLGIATTRP